MRLVFSLVLLLSAAGASIEADNPSLSGNWKIHSNIVGNESDADCNFVQKGNQLTGDCSSEGGSSKAAGEVDGAKINWAYDTQYNGGPLTIKYSGTLDSNAGKITGTVSVEQYSVDGDFTATRSK
jgi:hypothetical protein